MHSDHEEVKPALAVAAWAIYLPQTAVTKDIETSDQNHFLSCCFREIQTQKPNIHAVLPVLAISLGTSEKWPELPRTIQRICFFFFFLIIIS